MLSNMTDMFVLQAGSQAPRPQNCMYNCSEDFHHPSWPAHSLAAPLPMHIASLKLTVLRLHMITVTSAEGLTATFAAASGLPNDDELLQ